jgi:uncharacterized protein (TIGR02391 family)
MSSVMGNAQSLTFTQAQLTAIADALGHTEEGLIGNEIAYLLATCNIKDTHPDLTKRYRVFNALANDQTTRGDRTGILAFIRHSMKPERFVRTPARFEPLRARLNQALLFAGLVVLESGELEKTEAVRTLSGANQRAQELRADLTSRGVHADVLKFCREELLADDYFHAVLEAVKSVADKLRVRTGLTDDGATLVERALTGSPPVLAINALKTESEQNEQRGFANLVRGAFGMFRNTTAHAPRIHWPMTKTDAEDLLSLVSLIHRRIDGSHMPSRA